jgi:hypothetical protein
MKSLGLLAHHARFTDTQFYNLRSCELEPACSRHCDNTRIMTSTTRKITSHWRCLRFWVEFEWRIVWRNWPLRSLLVLVLSWMLPGLNPKRTWFSSRHWSQLRPTTRVKCSLFSSVLQSRIGNTLTLWRRSWYIQDWKTAFLAGIRTCIVCKFWILNIPLWNTLYLFTYSLFNDAFCVTRTT